MRHIGICVLEKRYRGFVARIITQAKWPSVSPAAHRPSCLFPEAVSSAHLSFSLSSPCSHRTRLLFHTLPSFSGKRERHGGHAFIRLPKSPCELMQGARMHSTLRGKAACMLSVETHTNLASTVQLRHHPRHNLTCSAIRVLVCTHYGHWERGCAGSLRSSGRPLSFTFVIFCPTTRVASNRTCDV